MLKIKVKTVSGEVYTYGEIAENYIINTLAEAEAFILGIAFTDTIEEAEAVYNGELYIYTEDGLIKESEITD